MIANDNQNDVNVMNNMKESKRTTNTTNDSTIKWHYKWPQTDGHKPLTLQRSASADSVLIANYSTDHMVDIWQTYCRIDCSTQTPEEWEDWDKSKAESKVKSSQNTSNTKREPSNSLDSTSTTSAVSTVQKCPTIDEHKDSTNTDALIPIITTIAASATSNSSTSSTGSSKSGPIAIPNRLNVEMSPNYRSANSVEELNQEIETLVLRGICDESKTRDRIREGHREGHRAPVIELLWPKRTVKTQTLISVDEKCSDNSDVSQSESPISPREIIAVNDTNGLEQSSSPKINKFLTREPPDGCEKVRIVSEDERSHSCGDRSPLKPSSAFVLLPSISSAFLPIFKTNYTTNESTIDCFKHRRNQFN